MEIVIKLTQFLLSLSLLIILHELGHFIPAKLFKTRVEKFYLFFDVKYSLFKKKIGETEYGIGWLPLGGYVKISGMIDESMDKEQMKEEPKPWEFRTKPAWQRLIIMLGGVTVNFILAFMIYIGMAFFYGDAYIPTSELKDGIAISNPLMQEAGFKTGDKIISIDGEQPDRFSKLNAMVLFGKNVIVERQGTLHTISMPVDLIDKMVNSKERSLIDLRAPFVVADFVPESLNKDNLKSRDIVVALDGQKIKYFDEASAILDRNKNNSITATVLRNKKEVKTSLQINEDGKIGVHNGGASLKSLEKLGYYKISREEYGVFGSIPVGIQRGKEQVGGYLKQLQIIFSPETGAYKGIGGFKAIFDIFPETWSWEAFWSITALLSIMLGVMNLLPIPALDGGHVMFLLFEMISGRKPSDKFMEYAQMTGFVLLIALLLFANGNDIYRSVVGK
ncbi:MAG: RIP metalloprotease RseP [Flavobacteriales bacterium]|nr:RIP metalloprotease RseP [Flavobacteriales bacterium]